jgi:hypothetical protein
MDLEGIQPDGWWSKFPDNPFPNENIDSWMDHEVDVQLPGFNFNAFNTWIDSVTYGDGDVLQPPECYDVPNEVFVPGRTINDDYVPNIPEVLLLEPSQDDRTSQPTIVKTVKFQQAEKVPRRDQADTKRRVKGKTKPKTAMKERGTCRDGSNTKPAKR